MSTAGDMFRIARQRLGMTQKHAAERLGVTQPVLSRIENGLNEPDSHLRRLASVGYEIPESFFDIKEAVYGPPVSVHPMLRGKSDVTARDLDMIAAELNIRTFHLRQFMEAVDFEPSSSLPSMDVEQYGSPSRIAATTRAHWGVPSGPIRNLTALMERAGIIIGHSDFGGASVSGVTFKIPGKHPLVLINNAHPADRTRFTLAHELGHLIMHRFPTAGMEQEANEFASALLMPENDIKTAFRSRKVTLETLAALKPEWKVAMQALLMRASHLGLVSANQSRYLWQQISMRGWRTREPVDLDFEKEQPVVLPTIIKAQFSEMGYSLEELSQMSNLHVEEFRKYYGDFTSRSSFDRPKLRIVR